MARPVNADPELTRRKLLDGAIRLFAARGFHGVSTREIAAAARVNVATLSYYFASKQGLYEATVDEVYRRIAERVGAASAGASLGDLDALVEGIYLAARAERDGIRVLLREVLDHGRLSARTEARHFLPGLESTAQLAEALLGAPPAQARAAAVAFGYLLSRYVIQDDASLRAAFGARSSHAAHAQVVRTLTAAARALLAPPGRTE
jgi:AcrR family transcriptional regulator